MQIKEIRLKKIKLNLTTKMIPSSANYCDLLLNLTNKELDSYTLFTFQEEGDFALGGISDIGPAFNIYANSESSSLKVFRYLKKFNNNLYPKYLRGNLTTKSLLHKLIEEDSLSISRLKTVIPMSIQITNKVSPISLRRANINDYSVIEKWLEEYNRELNEQFPFPRKTEIETKDIFLATFNKTVVGGYIRTVKNSDRYWLARFFLFQEYRGLHLGHNFIDAIQQQFASKHNEIHLHVTENNIKAKNLYTKYGFKTLGRTFNATIGED